MSLLKNTLLIFFLSFAVSGSAALTGQWSFDTLNDSVSSTAGGLSGGASISSGQLNLTGTGGFEANTTGGLGGTGSFSVVVDFQTTTSADQTIFSYSPSGGGIAGGDLRLFAQANGNIRIEMSNGAGHEINLGTLDLNDGATHRVAAVFDSSTGNSFYDVDVFVDDTFYNVTSGVDATINLGGSGFPNEISFGYQVHFSGNRPFTGTMDFAEIHDVALSGAEITAIPEPATFLMATSALALFAMSQLRRR